MHCTVASVSMSELVLASWVALNSGDGTDMVGIIVMINSWSLQVAV